MFVVEYFCPIDGYYYTQRFDTQVDALKVESILRKFKADEIKVFSE